MKFRRELLVVSPEKLLFVVSSSTGVALAWIAGESLIDVVYEGQSPFTSRIKLY